MAKDRIERDELASKLIETASSAEDPLRAMAELITGFLMEAEVTAKVGAEPHERNEQRTTHRNGYRDRRWDTPGVGAKESPRGTVTSGAKRSKTRNRQSWKFSEFAKAVPVTELLPGLDSDEIGSKSTGLKTGYYKTNKMQLGGARFRFGRTGKMSEASQ